MNSSYVIAILRSTVSGFSSLSNAVNIIISSVPKDEILSDKIKKEIWSCALAYYSNRVTSDADRKAAQHLLRHLAVSGGLAHNSTTYLTDELTDCSAEEVFVSKSGYAFVRDDLLSSNFFKNAYTRNFFDNDELKTIFKLAPEAFREKITVPSFPQEIREDILEILKQASTLCDSYGARAAEAAPTFLANIASIMERIGDRLPDRFTAFCLIGKRGCKEQRHISAGEMKIEFSCYHEYAEKVLGYFSDLLQIPTSFGYIKRAEYLGLVAEAAAEDNGSRKRRSIAFPSLTDSPPVPSPIPPTVDREFPYLFVMAVPEIDAATSVPPGFAFCLRGMTVPEPDAATPGKPEALAQVGIAEKGRQLKRGLGE